MRTGVRLRSGEDIVLIGVHPEPPSPTEADSSLPRDAELVLLGREIANEARPVIVAGDLNDVAWSRTSRLFRRLSGLIDPRVGRGFYNSFHAHPRGCAGRSTMSSTARTSCSTTCAACRRSGRTTSRS